MVAEDTLSGDRVRQKVNLVVLATGLVPAPCGAEIEVEGGLERDAHGFLVGEQASGGLLAAGCAKRPVEVGMCVRDATGVALKAFQCSLE